MYRYGRHFGSFYRNPTTLETVSIAWVHILVKTWNGQHEDNDTSRNMRTRFCFAMFRFGHIIGSQ